MVLPKSILSKIKALFVERVATWFIGLMGAAGAGFMWAIPHFKAWFHKVYLDSLWPTQDQIWLASALVFSAVVGLVCYAKHRAEVRETVEEEKKLARGRRRKEQAQAKKKNPGHATPPRNGIVSETRRDPEFRKVSRRTALGMSGAIVGILITGDKTFALSATVWPRHGYPMSEVMLILERASETIATGITETNGRCKFDRLVSPGPCRLIAYRVVGDAVEWSMQDLMLDYAHKKSGMEIGSFPDFRCERQNIDLLGFSKGEALVLPEAAKTIGDVNTKFRGFSGLMVIQGRTCNAAFLPGSEIDNHVLSTMRCKAVADCLHPHLPLSQIVLAPLEDKYPLYSSDKLEEMRKHERTVLLIPLLRVAAPEH